ncbi:MAG: hypothetical protein ACE10K_07745 [Rhodothermales bacterium]
MLARSFLYLAVMLLAITSFSACGRQDKAPEAAEDQATEDTTNLAAQIQSIHQNLRRAGWHAKRNNREAAPLFSDVATLLSQRAAVASNAVKEDLQFSASELTGLSERIYSGPPITLKELYIAHARTYWALAAFHQEQAATLWPDGNAQEIALHLVSSADFITAAIGYAGEPAKEPGRDLVKRMKDLAQQVEGEPPSDAVSRQIQEVGQEIRKLSNRVKQFLS